MRRLCPAVLAVLVSLPLAADNIRFEPPNPTSATPVIAHVIGSGCVPVSGIPTRAGQSISIALPCVSPFVSSFDIRVDLGVLPAGVYDVFVGAGGLALNAEATLPVRDADAPFVVKPNVSDTLSYGGSVRLNGDGIAKCGATICTPVVKFGGVPATRVTPTSTSEIVVELPPHQPAIVDVTIEREGTTLRSTAAFHYFGAVPNAAFFERVLMPVFFSGPGAFGSQWKTEAALYNADDYAIEEAGTPFFGVCNWAVTCPTPPLSAGAGMTTFAKAESVPTGVVTFLPRYAMPNVHFSLLVRDLSRDATDFGTSVPVVRENEMFTRPFSLVNVPSDPRYRLGLRLYAYDTIPTRFHITMTPISGGNVANFDVNLLPANEHAFAFIGDLLAEHPEVAGKGALRIDISPFEPATRAWGYVSITNNDTQHVTVIAPE